MSGSTASPKYIHIQLACVTPLRVLEVVIDDSTDWDKSKSLWYNPCPFFHVLASSALTPTAIELQISKKQITLAHSSSTSITAAAGPIPIISNSVPSNMYRYAQIRTIPSNHRSDLTSPVCFMGIALQHCQPQYSNDSKT